MKKIVVLFFLMLLVSIPRFGKAAVPEKKQPMDQSVVWGEMPAGAKTTYIGIHGGTVPVSLLTAGDGSPMVAMVGMTGSDFLNFLRSNGKLQEELVLPELPTPKAEGMPRTEMKPAITPKSETVSSNFSEHSQEVNELPKTSAEKRGTSSGTDLAARTHSETAKPALTPDVLDPQFHAAVLELFFSEPPVDLPATKENLPTPGSNATLLLAGTEKGRDVLVIYATGSAFERMSLIPANWAPFGLTEKALSLEGEVKVLSTPKKMPRNRKKSSRR